MIHICFGLHDADGHYSKFVGTTMASIFENTASPVTIHILHDSTLTNDNRDKFSYMAGKYGQGVNFHNVEELCPDEINFLRDRLAEKLRMRFSIGTFYRLLMKKIFGTGKIIYLDADIIVNLDIAELWRQDLQNFPLAAVPEIIATQRHMIVQKFLLNTGLVELEDYFCAGVAVFDLDKFDEKFFYDGLQFLTDNPQCESFDQDILNSFFSENYLKLEQKFDSFVLAERMTGGTVAQKIYHYAGNCIEPKLEEGFNRLFMEFFTRTPWFNVDMLGRIFDNYRSEREDWTLRHQQAMRLAFEHTRAFFVDPQNVWVIKILFCIHDDEPIIEFNGENSVEQLSAIMNEQRGQRLFFICLDDYKSVGLELIRRGFKEYEEFVNGQIFLTKEQCGYMAPEYEYIKAL